jgi:hypothetical protein
MKLLRDDLVECFAGRSNYQPNEQVVKELEEDLQAMDSITQYAHRVALSANHSTCLL